MNQLAIAFADTVVEFAAARASCFRDDFVPWLSENLHIWSAFENHANTLYLRGKRHRSARGIVHYLREDTALRERPEGEWKINNNVSPDLARLWLLIHPERDGFFELRDNPERTSPVRHFPQETGVKPSASSDCGVGGVCRT
jgi:hypothetical protein